MQKRNSGFNARMRWLAPAAALSMVGCPKQELAPLGPCTVSSVREDVNQTGISKVDLLFVIDNSFSMANEQKNLTAQLPRLIKVLTTGDRYAGRENQVPAGLSAEDRYFTPVSSLRLGVVTSELEVLTRVQDMATGLAGCLKAGNDNALLQTSVQVATEGQRADRSDSAQMINTGDTLIAPRPECANQTPALNYLQFDTANKTPAELTRAADQTALQFGCIATIGALGCAYEQQLEAMWKALAPSTGPADFLGGTKGHGSPAGANKGFVRDDAVLAILQVSDEEDCSISEAGRVLFESPATGIDEWTKVPANLRCGVASEMKRDDLIRPVDRYIKGLKSLKGSNPDRVIFAGLVGIPPNLEDDLAQGKFDEVLAAPDMQFRALSPGSGLPQPSCSVVRPGSSVTEVAYPPRRFVEVARGFGENAALYSICRADYGDALDQIIERIAAKLKGNCLPRKLTPDSNGVVRCEVYELLPPDGAKTCDTKKGHIGSVETRKVTEGGKVVDRLACKVAQVPVRNDKPTPNIEGWYYDDFSDSLKTECDTGEQQRIVFTPGAQLPPGAGATFECFQPVANITSNARGFDAINTRCDNRPAVCAERSNASEGGYDLICVEPLRTCQISCKADPNCPPGWVCATINDGTGPAPKYCQQPTCQTNPTGGSAAEN